MDPLRIRSTAVRLRLVLVAAVIAGGCASAGPEGPPRPGWTSGPAVSLDGARVLVLPAQTVRGVSGDVDAELAFGLESRGERVSWILPAELRRALERSPGLQANPDALPVGMFLQAEVRRIGDPLYGELRRMAALTDAAAAFLPVAVRARPAADSVPAGVEIVAALVDVRSGGVLWSGVVEGLGVAGSPAALAAAVDALALAMMGSTGVESDDTRDPEDGGDASGGPPRHGHDGMRRGGAASGADGAGGGGALHLFR